MVSSIEFMKCTSVFDKDKKFNPSYDDKITTKIDCDDVIIAIGQATDLAVLSKYSNVKTTRGGWLISDPVTLATDDQGVFAGGDAVTGPKSAVEAIAHGHEAAISIERYLSGLDIKRDRTKVKEEPAPIPEGKHPKIKRVKQNQIALERRVSSFDEMNLVYTEEEAKKEADRCLNCGLCSECLQCVTVCQAKAIDHTQKAEKIDINVGSIVLAPGFDPFNANIKG
jgi:NADPH-dependent glutamate synthase beta subunit-like oxidoreductase